MNKKIKKSLLFSFFLVLIVLTAEAEVPVFEIETEVLVELDISGPREGWIYDDYVIINGNPSVRIDTNSLELKVFDSYTEVGKIKGFDEQGNFIVVRGITNPTRESKFKLYSYNPLRNEYSLFEGIHYVYKYENRRRIMDRVYSWYNNYYFVSYSQTNVGWISYHTLLINRTTGEEKEIAEHYILFDISPDRMHLLLSSPYKGYAIYNVITGEKTATLPLFETDNKYIDFISNNLILYSLGGKGEVFNLKGEKVVEFNYLKSTNSTSVSDDIEKIENSVFGFDLISDGNWVLKKALGEKEALDSLGLLFHPTTGTANDSRVRIREWPLLDANHLGYLTTGDKLEILDRSGIKVKIGDMEDYWYKIRRPSDGVEGWSYGAFIDLDE